MNNTQYSWEVVDLDDAMKFIKGLILDDPDCLDEDDPRRKALAALVHAWEHDCVHIQRPEG